MSVIRCAMIFGCLCGFLGIAGCCGPMACGTPGGNIFGLGAGCGGCNGGCDSCDGCGELYIDPWINEPADRCDPCDCCGNFNGQSCGKCRPVLSGLANLWGYRCDNGCDSGGCGSCSSGCDSCSGGCESGGCTTCGSGNEHYGAINYSGGDGEIAEYSEPAIVSGTPRVHSYQPDRTKKIFRPRANVAAARATTHR